jgi:two-component sensor histidine kinase
MNNVLVTIDSAIPCGLIINELISNVFKHAFPQNQTGEIQISLKMINDQIEFKVNDNGIGFPDGLDVRNVDTIGLQSVVSLAEHQLSGSVEVTKDNGTRFSITFKDQTYKERI